MGCNFAPINLVVLVHFYDTNLRELKNLKSNFPQATDHTG